MLAVFSLFLVMFGLVAWAFHYLLIDMGDKHFGPLSVDLDETIRSKRYKTCKAWMIIGGACIVSGIAILYAFY